MLPPILEIYIVWHPDDSKGLKVAEQIFDHFHGTAYSGLVGGAIEVYTRSTGWRSDQDAPRPIPYPIPNLAQVVPAARLVVVVPILGNGFTEAVESGTGAWWEFAQAINNTQSEMPHNVGVFPLLLDRGANEDTELGRIFGRFQLIAAPSPHSPLEPEEELRCRDLSQGITQLALGPHARLTVFISHTKKTANHEEDVPHLIALVRNIIGQTRLDQFFDANDLQPGGDWDDELRSRAATSALIALRTDLYASRTWCQREMLIAKRNGMPIVILDSLGQGEERGSFLMDHLPRIPVREENDRWSEGDIRRGLNQLVDECLKRALWNLQKELAAGRTELAVDWWAPHAPEPVTLIQWIEDSKRAEKFQTEADTLRILHPDPPLGPDELETLQQIVTLSGHKGTLDVMTPRILAGRGG